MTEDEAKTKWCPLVRTIAGFHSVGNRLERRTLPVNSYCIGSACMAWRNETREEYNQRIKDPDQTKLTLGYCGAFGKL